jgi:hypothetical protein
MEVWDIDTMYRRGREHQSRQNDFDGTGDGLTLMPPAELVRRAYRRRAKVENCVGWLKENRRVGTRYDKLAASFLAFVSLAIVRRYLKILAPDDPSDRA